MNVSKVYIGLFSWLFKNALPGNCWQAPEFSSQLAHVRIRYHLTANFLTCDQASLIFFVAAGRYLSTVTKNARDEWSQVTTFLSFFFPGFFFFFLKLLPLKKNQHCVWSVWHEEPDLRSGVQGRLIAGYEESAESILLTTPGPKGHNICLGLRQNDALLEPFFSQSKCSDIISIRITSLRSEIKVRHGC